MSKFDAMPEPGKVRQMFDGIAGSYDRLNDLMTAGLHHRWRDMGVMVSGVGPGSSALDVCCGTGDFAFALKRAVGPTGRVIGLDVSEEMLKVAREKCGRNQLHVEFRTGDVLELPFPDGGAAVAGRTLAPGAAASKGAPAGAPFDAAAPGAKVRPATAAPPSGNGSSSTSPVRNSTCNWLRPHFSRATFNISSETSNPITRPVGPTARFKAKAKSPVPQHTSKALEPGPTPLTMTPMSRQRWCSPAVMRSFNRSYDPAIPSNICLTLPGSGIASNLLMARKG